MSTNDNKQAKQNRLDGQSTLWTYKDLAAYLNISENTARKYKMKGMLPCTKIGGLVRFDPVVIKQWLKNHTSLPKGDC